MAHAPPPGVRAFRTEIRAARVDSAERYVHCPARGRPVASGSDQATTCETSPSPTASPAQITAAPRAVPRAPRQARSRGQSVVARPSDTAIGVHSDAPTSASPPPTRQATAPNLNTVEIL